MAEQLKKFIGANLSLAIFRSLVIFLLLGLHVFNSQAEYFSSIDKIQMLSLIEKDFIQWYRNFTATQAEDFAVFRNFIAKVKEDHKVALKDPEAFLSNPMNSFKLIKRTVDEWAQISEYVNNHTGLHALKTNFTNLENLMHLPDSNELEGAAKGLGRIQTVYNFTSHDLAKGVINGKHYGTKLSASDCFEIGASLFQAREYPFAIDWFKLALKYLKTDKNKNATKSEKEVELDDDLIQISDFDEEVDYKPMDNKKETKLDEGKTDKNNDYAIEDVDVDFKHKPHKKESKLGEEKTDEDSDDYVLDDDFASDDDINLFNEEADKLDSDEELEAANHMPTAKDTNNKLENATLTSDDGKIFMETLEYLALAKYELGQREEAVSYIEQILELEPEHTFKDMEIYMRLKEPRNETSWDSLRALSQRPWFANYTRLCQSKQLPQKDLNKLTCTLDTLNHPLFILAPLKRELLLADPEVVIYYDLLSNNQTLHILEKSYLHMQRSTVGTGPHKRVLDVRVSQQTWLQYNTSTTKYIYNTVSAISGYDLRNSEQLQVVNYGIGGQYHPHYDFIYTSGFGGIVGDRIATYLFYISDVELGGNTVFPFLNVYSKPVKGAMLMWHNLHKSVDPDFRTLHAGCPVVVGTKRITNVWVHSGYQEFKRPCDLVSDTFKSDAFFKLF